MARWRLTAKHYIYASRHGEPTQWVREETNRDTGRTNRKTYTVPLYLDPEQAADQNYPGEIIISTAKGSHAQDIIVADDFIPTIDMEPLDEAAEKLSEKVLRVGNHPIDSLPAQGITYGEVLLEKLNQQLTEAARVADTGDSSRIAKLEADLKALMEANAKLQAQIKPTVSERKA